MVGGLCYWHYACVILNTGCIAQLEVPCVFMDVASFDLNTTAD